MTTTPPIEEVDDDREPVFSVHEAKLPKVCERCKSRRPRTCILKLTLGRPIGIAFLCGSCGEHVRKEAALVAERIREGLSKDFGEESIEVE